MDKQLLLIVAILTLTGIVMVYSATSIMCAKMECYSSSTYFLKQQLIRVGVALAGFVLATQLDYRLLKKWSFVILILSALLLLALTIPRFAAGSIKGANRWLDLGAANIQPSEITKLALIIFLAEYLAKKRKTIGDFKKTFLPVVGISGLFIIAVALQPNYGMAIAISIVTAIMFFVAGARFLHLAAIAVPTSIAMVLAIMHSDHAQRRVMTFINGGDLLGDGFQIRQSLIAIGAGGLTGKGIGQGIQKLFYIPEIHTDFIFAVIGEELGFLGTTFILILFALLAWRGIKIAMRAPDAFGQNLAIGITAMISVYTAINIGVVLKLIPTTGIPLPFISFGGSALLITMVSCGILLNISTHVWTPLVEHISVPDEIEIPEGPDASLDGRRRNRRTSNPGAEYRPGVVSTSSGR